MATGQSLLDLMQVLDNELLLQSGEADVTRGLIALNAAQDLFESVVAGHPDLMGDTIGTVTVTSGTETTAYPTGLLRLDKLWLLENSIPLYPLSKVDMAGGHAANMNWPWNLTSAAAGKTRGYWCDGRSIYWLPRPNETSTVRWYGFQAATDITANGTFLYPDIAMLPICAFAVTLMRAGVGDDAVDLAAATGSFAPVVKQLATFNRDRASRLIYSQIHTT